MGTDKRKIQYVIDGTVNSGFFKALNSTNRALAKASREAGAMRKVQSAVGSTGASLVKTAVGFAAAYIGIQQVASAYRSCTKEAMGQARADIRLDQLMRNVKGTRQDQIEGIKAYASALQKVTVVGDDLTTFGASQLATFQLQGDNIKKLIPSLQDLMVGTYGVNVSQEQAQQSANLLGKVFTGQVGALRRVGVTFSKTQEKILKTGTQSEKTAMLIKVIQQNYGGLARRLATDDPEGRAKVLANTWGEVKEQIGFSLLKLRDLGLEAVSGYLPELQKWAERFTANLDKMTTKLQGMKGKLGPVKQQFMEIFRPIWDVLVSKVWPVIKKIGADLWKMFQEAWPKIQPVLKELGAAIAQWIGAIMPIVSKIWQYLNPVLRWVLGTLLPALINLVAIIVRSSASVITKFTEWSNKLKGVWDWLKRIGSILANNPLVKTAITTGKVVLQTAKAAARAEGGPVSAGRAYIVGERGPELMVPRGSGTIVPNLALAGARVTFSGPINFYFTGGASHEAATSGRTAAQAFRKHLSRLMADERRRGFVDS